MISVLLISHGMVADAMVHSAEMIIGKQLRLDALTLVPEDSVETFQRKLMDTLAGIHPEHGLIVLSDFPLGTPFNTVIQRMAEFPHLTGMNMPMLLRVLRDRTDPDVNAETLCERGMASAHQESFYVNRFVRELRERQNEGELP